MSFSDHFALDKISRSGRVRISETMMILVCLHTNHNNNCEAILQKKRSEKNVQIEMFKKKAQNLAKGVGIV